jgi:hypothetical protein
MHILPKFWLLKAIRDGVITERQFETCLGSIEGPDFHWFVSHLAELGAIRVHENGKIEPQEWISKCTATFGISLTEFEKYDTHLSVVANPEFRKPPNDSVAPDVFVVSSDARSRKVMKNRRLEECEKNFVALNG